MQPGASGFACTVLIPAHNEALTIREIAADALVHSSHVMVISDGSTDETVACLEDLQVQVVAHPDNLGKGPRLAEGLDLAAEGGFTHVLTMDADGQHIADDIPAFTAAAKTNPNALILGDRMGTGTAMPQGRARSISIGDFFITWATGHRLRDGQCGMRVYPVALWQGLRLNALDTQHFVFETAILMHAAEAGAPFVRVPIAARYGDVVKRPSHFRPARDTWRICGAIARFILCGWFRPRGLLIALGLLR
ncbi:MAG: glycosyltransferase family 2 protein [Paracoccaceae bacterium]